MILSDTDLIRLLDANVLRFDPPVDRYVQVQPASIDLRLGNDFRVYRALHTPVIDPRDPDTLRDITEVVHVPNEEAFILHPGLFALGTTIERVAVPNFLVARVEGRSSLGRLAVVVHATAGFIDPGFEGQVTLELSNLGHVPVKLYPGMRICQLVFHEMRSPCSRPYGPGRGSKYHGQEGPVESRLDQDIQEDEG